MRKSAELNPLMEPLSALKELLEDGGYRWMIIGGVAASLLGKPRFTADVDVVALIEDEDLPVILKTAKKLGFKPRIKGAAEFALKNRVLLLIHVKTGINVDLSMGLLPFEKDAVKRSRRLKISDISFNLPTPEDLIILKAVAHRARDMEDIKEVIKVHPKIDKRYIANTVKEFAGVLEMPEIWRDIKSILYPHPR
jgi:predicted nucleotidyltransferase